jgi:hypothetical protein
MVCGGGAVLIAALFFVPHESGNVASQQWSSTSTASYASSYSDDSHDSSRAHGGYNDGSSFGSTATSRRVSINATPYVLVAPNAHKYGQLAGADAEPAFGRCKVCAFSVL